MMKRLYFLVPDAELAHQVVDDFHEAGIQDSEIHVIADESVEMTGLPEAGVRQSSNIAKAAGRGGVSGGATGLLAGVLAMSFPPAGVAIGGGMVAVTTLLGTGFGAWMASMIGISTPNEEIRRFEAAIHSGELLVLVDVAEHRRSEIQDTIRQRHPGVEIGNTEATTPEP